MIKLEKTNIFPLFEKRNENTNKGSFGTACLVCGSYGMAGAAAIATRSCTLSGVGIARVVCDKSIYPIVSANVPEAVFVPLDKNDDENKLIKSIEKCNAIAFGCGVGVNDTSKNQLETLISSSKVPLIIDADGINCLAQNIDLIKKAKSPLILTPHPGEFSRLTGFSIAEIQANREKYAVDFAKKHGVTLVLKGSGTIVTDGNKTYINTSGNAGMATAGSGDMLTGIITALLCQGFSPLDATTAGVFIHGLCGDICAKKYSMYSTIPDTMLKCLPKVFLEIENQL